jgi:hypothetical protein
MLVVWDLWVPVVERGCWEMNSFESNVCRSQANIEATAEGLYVWL